MLHRRAPYIARIFEISIEMLQCNKSECETVLFVEFCGMSEQSKDGMGAAEAKLTELVALVSQLQTGWKFIVDYHRARMRGKGSLPCHWWAALSGRDGTTTFVCSNICCAAAISFPLGGTRSDPAMLLLRDRSHCLAPRSSPMDEHRAQGLETSKPVGATSHSGSDVHPKNQEGAAADLVTHTTKAAGEVVEHAKAAAEEIIDHAKSTAGEALTSMAEDVARQAPEIAQRVRDQASTVADDLYRTGGEYVSRQVERYPLTSVLLAAAVGYGLGYLVSRRA